MTTGPGDEQAAARRGDLRASHADREQAVETLKAAFVQGRLDKDELDLRAGQALASRTYAELAAVTADLPAGLAEARPPAPARGSVNKKRKAVAALSVATLALAGIMAVPTPSMPDGPFTLLIICLFWLLLSAVATGWLWLFHAWLDQRAGTQSAQGLPPGPSGQAAPRLPPADPGRQLPPGDDRRWHTRRRCAGRSPPSAAQLTEEPVMAEPPDQMPAAGGRGHLRASHADRERVVGILKAAFVQGRFTKDEFDLRVSQAFTARTYAELAALTADLPPCPPAAGPARPPAPVRRRPLARAAAKSGGCLIIAAAATWAFLLLVSQDGHYHGIPGANPSYENWAPLPCILAAVALFTAIGIMGSAVATSLEQRRSRRQLPPGRAPGAGGQAPRRPPPADPGRQLPPADPGHQQAAEAAPRRRPRRSLPGSQAWRRWRARGLPAGQRPAITHTA